MYFYRKIYHLMIVYLYGDSMKLRSTKTTKRMIVYLALIITCLLVSLGSISIYHNSEKNLQPLTPFSISMEATGSAETTDNRESLQGQILYGALFSEADLIYNKMVVTYWTNQGPYVSQHFQYEYYFWTSKGLFIPQNSEKIESNPSKEVYLYIDEESGAEFKLTLNASTKMLSFIEYNHIGIFKKSGLAEQNLSRISLLTYESHPLIKYGEVQKGTPALHISMDIAGKESSGEITNENSGKVYLTPASSKRVYDSNSHILSDEQSNRYSKISVKIPNTFHLPSCVYEFYAPSNLNGSIGSYKSMEDGSNSYYEYVLVINILSSDLHEYAGNMTIRSYVDDAEGHIIGIQYFGEIASTLYDETGKTIEENLTILRYEGPL